MAERESIEDLLARADDGESYRKLDKELVGEFERVVQCQRTGVSPEAFRVSETWLLAVNAARLVLWKLQQTEKSQDTSL